MTAVVDAGGRTTDADRLAAELTTFLDAHLRPLEGRLLTASPEERRELTAGVRRLACREGLLHLAAPRSLGGRGLPLTAYAPLAEIEGRYLEGPAALGSHQLLDLVNLDRYAGAGVRARVLPAVLAGEVTFCYGMTEPGCSGSDLMQMRTRARRDGDHWVISGRKWFAKAIGADLMTVFCRTGSPGAGQRDAFSMILVPVGTPGFEIVRELPVLGMRNGHAEVRLHDVRVPLENLLGAEGDGYRIALERLALGRLLRSMVWVGQAARAFELLCDRLRSRRTATGMLGDQQLMQQHVFDAYTAIAGARALLQRAARSLEDGDRNAPVEVAAAKVVASRMLQEVTDRAIQVYGAEGLTDDTVLAALFREARSARIYDGPDEVHVRSVATQVLRRELDRPAAAVAAP